MRTGVRFAGFLKRSNTFFFVKHMFAFLMQNKDITKEPTHFTLNEPN